MVAFTSSFTPAEPVTRSKNRAGDFFWWSGECAGFDRSATRTVAGENDRFSYDACRGPALPQKVDCDELKKVLSSGDQDAIRNFVKGKVSISGDVPKKWGDADRFVNKIADDLIQIGSQGGDLGLAMFRHSLSGGMSIRMDFDLQVANAQGQTLNLNPSAYGYSGFTREDYSWGRGVFLSNAEVVAHEMGHALLDLRDPFNVPLVQNRVARSFRANGLIGLHRTTYSGRPVFPAFDQPGYEWRGDNILHAPWKVPFDEWWGKMRSGMRKVDEYLKEWGCE
jgi:hypothetical protein